MGMAVMLRAGRSTVSLVRPGGVLRDRTASIYSKPPRNKIGAGQSFLIMSVFAVALLVPAGWILRHLPDYRQRDATTPDPTTPDPEAPAPRPPHPAR